MFEEVLNIAASSVSPSCDSLAAAVVLVTDLGVRRILLRLHAEDLRLAVFQVG